MPDLSGGALVVTIGLFILLAIAITAVIVLRVRRRDAERAMGAIPLIVFPDADKSAGLPQRPRQQFLDPRTVPDQFGTSATAWAPPSAPSYAPAPAAVPFSPAPAPPYAMPPTAADPRPAAPTAPRGTSLVPDEVAARTGVPTRRVAPFAPAAAPNGNGTVTDTDYPADGTLQFLPGRLEVLEGQDAGQEIRFVRTGPRTEITFGRSEGPRYKHIQLREQTVSRLHARLTHEGTRWRLANLSQTNPLYVNGAPLDPSQPSVVLAEGDRIEMGEVVLRFRAH